MQEELCSTSNDTIIVNDTVPNWMQTKGQVRLLSRGKKRILRYQQLIGS